MLICTYNVCSFSSLLKIPSSSVDILPPISSLFLYEIETIQLWKTYWHKVVIMCIICLYYKQTSWTRFVSHALPMCHGHGSLVQRVRWSVLEFKLNVVVVWRFWKTTYRGNIAMIRADFWQGMEFHYYAATGSLLMQQSATVIWSYRALLCMPSSARSWGYNFQLLCSSKMRTLILCPVESLLRLWWYYPFKVSCTS